MRYRMSFYGQVQAVGFRYTARHAAERYRVTGWVRNEPDGSVTCEVQGRESDISAWEYFIYQARYINVDHVTKNEIPEDSDERGFEVKY